MKFLKLLAGRVELVLFHSLTIKEMLQRFYTDYNDQEYLTSVCLCYI